jgi:Cu(I)/Ag(I) efflux system membrane protein CusA/SilA
MVEKLYHFHSKTGWLSFSFGCFVFGASVQQNPIDAIPDLSENQVIVLQNGWKKPAGHRRSSNLSTSFNLQGIPKIKNIRASSMFGMSFVYHFEDNVLIGSYELVFYGELYSVIAG